MMTDRLCVYTNHPSKVPKKLREELARGTEHKQIERVKQGRRSVDGEISRGWTQIDISQTSMDVGQARDLPRCAVERIGELSISPHDSRFYGRRGILAEAVIEGEQAMIGLSKSLWSRAQESDQEADRADLSQAD